MEWDAGADDLKGLIKMRRLSMIIFFTALLLGAGVSYAEMRWETGAKAGFDSNIDRAITGGKSDSFLTGFFSFVRFPEGNKKLDWTFDAGIEGTAYAQSGDLNYAAVLLAPGVVFHPHAKWSLAIAPFIQVKGVRDSEQSAVAFGGKIIMRQRWNDRYYTGQYFLYTDSNADAGIYSFEEKAAAAFAGINWTKAFWTELGYEFSRGDSFRTVENVASIPVGIGQGHRYRYSEAYSQYVFREPVDRHTIGINLGCDFTENIFSVLSYAYAAYRGDSGTSESHTASIGLGCRF